MAGKQGRRCGSRMTLLCVEILVCFVSMILQIVGFSTNSWAVMRNVSDNRLTNFGLWSTTVCYELECTTKTHMNEHKELMAKGFSSRGVQYAFQVGNEVNATLALVCVILCFILSIIDVICSVRKRQIKLALLILSLLSGVFLLTVVGYFTAELTANMRVKLNSIKTEFFFPWSLLISGFGAVIITINGLVLSVCACRGNHNSSYVTVKTKENISDSAPQQCVVDYAPPDYSEVGSESDQSAV